jgi:hypothetical protein
MTPQEVNERRCPCGKSKANWIGLCDVCFRGERVGILEALRRFADEPEMPREVGADVRDGGSVEEAPEDFWNEFYRVNDSSDRKND